MAKNYHRASRGISATQKWKIVATTGLVIEMFEIEGRPLVLGTSLSLWRVAMWSRVVFRRERVAVWRPTGRKNTPSTLPTLYPAKNFAF